MVLRKWKNIPKKRKNYYIYIYITFTFLSSYYYYDSHWFKLFVGDIEYHLLTPFGFIETIEGLIKFLQRRFLVIYEKTEE